MDVQRFYDELGDRYDMMVSWETRLAREEAFFRAFFQENGVRRILDAGCGTGMHAVRFARWGLTSAGADVSPVMIRRAEQNAREAHAEVRFEVAGFGGMSAKLGGGFDAVTCIGNSLPHLLDDAALRECLADFRAVLSPGGHLVVQNRNYDRLLKERQRFVPPAAPNHPDEETVFVRITDFPGPGAPSEEAVEFTLITLRKKAGVWSQSVQSTPLRALRRRTMEDALQAAGFGSLRAHGSYAGEPFDPAASPDLIMVARRAPGAAPR